MNSTTCIVVNVAALVIGQWLVTRGHWCGFLIWCAANLYSIVTCILTGMPHTSCLFGACFLVNFCALWSWLRKPRQDPPAAARPVCCSFRATGKPTPSPVPRDVGRFA